MQGQLALWKQLLFIVVLGAAGYGLWHERDRVTELTGISFGQEAGEERQGRRGRGRGGDAVPVIVEPIKMVQAVDTIQAVGTGRANRSITIYPEVSGIVSEIDFEAGQGVEKGDVLLELDNAQARIAVNIAETRLADANRTLSRSRTLLERNAIAEATFQTAETAVRTAELELEQAQEALAERTILAPFDGVLGIPQVETGDRVSDSTAITSLDDRSTIIVAFDVPEIYVNRLREGHKVTATTAGLRGREFEGEIAQINSRVDPVTRAVRVRAALANPDDVMRGGMSFNVNLILEGGTYPSIAELALLWERGGSYVWRVSDGKVERVGVEVVKRTNGRVLVDGEISEGQLVVVEGTQRLRPGREVNFERPDTTIEGTAGL